MKRVETFRYKDKNFMYFDLSNLRANTRYAEIIAEAKKIIIDYPENSVYSITNVKELMYDTETKTLLVQWMEFNRPYIKYGAIIGLDGIKKIMGRTILNISRRTNMTFAGTKEEAQEWLVQQP